MEFLQNVVGFILGHPFALKVASVSVTTFLIADKLRSSIMSIEGPILFYLRSRLTTPEEKEAARRVIRWIEAKFPDKLGSEKRLLAIKYIQKCCPIVPTSWAGRLVDDSVSAMNQILKDVETQL